jgi:hypothetical protein
MNQGAYVRYPILEHLIRLHDPKNYYFEVVCGGGIGIGKNYFCNLSSAYDIYKLSCLYSPTSYYELAPGSKIIFINQSKTEKLAKEVVFDQFGGMLSASSYFPKYFDYDRKFTKVMKFPNNVQVLPISSADTSALGMNVIGGVVDEMNFMSKVKKSKKQQHTDSEVYDQAEVLYTTIIRRMESRFDRLGRLPGKIYLVSSANYKDDFIDRKEKEAEVNSHIFTLHLAQWESFADKDGNLLPNKYCGKMFFVRKPSENAAAAIYDEKPEGLSEKEESNIIEVPVEHKMAFERDIIGSLRDIAGVAVVRSSRFISSDYIRKSFSLYKTVYGINTIFTTDSVELSVNSHIADLINVPVLQRLSPLGPFAIHIDLAVSGDAAGVAIGHAIGGKEIKVRSTFDSNKGHMVQEPQGVLPVYGLPGLLQVVPPKDGEIELHILRSLIGLVCDFLPVYWLTMDRHQSATFLQFFRGRGITSSIISVDRSPDPYIETKFAIKEGRVYIAPNPVVIDEMPHLDQDITTGKIDHPEGKSKDLSDAIASVVYNLSDKKTSYRNMSSPVMIPVSVVKPEKYLRSRGSRPSSGRKSIY